MKLLLQIPCPKCGESDMDATAFLTSDETSLVSVDIVEFEGQEFSCKCGHRVRVGSMQLYEDDTNFSVY